MRKSIMRKCKLGVLLILICMLISGITAFAETKDFHFVLTRGACDAGYWTAVKADNEQTAYITPTSIVGSGRIWASVYDTAGATQYTYDVAIKPGETYRHSTSYYVTGVPDLTYRLLGCDNEWEVSSNTFAVYGRWTP